MEQNINQVTKLYYTIKDLSTLLNLSDKTVRRMEVAGIFPRRRQISCRRVGWLIDEVEAWVVGRK